MASMGTKVTSSEERTIATVWFVLSAVFWTAVLVEPFRLLERDLGDAIFFLICGGFAWGITVVVLGVLSRFLIDVLFLSHREFRKDPSEED